MQFFVNIFWNRDQRRIRALWRLVGQLILLVVLVLPTQLAIALAAVAMLLFQADITPGQLSDPAVIQKILDSQDMQALITTSPFLMMFSTLLVLVAVLVSVWLAGRLLDRRPFANFGFHLGRNWWIDLGYGLGLGAFLMLLIFLVELAFGWVTVTGTMVTRDPDGAFLAAILAPLVMFVAVGIYEELFSRGYQLQNMAEGLKLKAIGPRGAIVIATLLSSAVFGLLHMTNPNASLVSTFNIFFAGVFILSMGYILTGELAIPIGVHITWNFFQGNVFGFPVSGGDFGSAMFIAIQQGGPDLWTGGAFGPEAGLVGVVAVLLGGLLIALWVGWRYGRARLYMALAEAPVRPGQKSPQSAPSPSEEMVDEGGGAT